MGAFTTTETRTSPAAPSFWIEKVKSPPTGRAARETASLVGLTLPVPSMFAEKAFGPSTERKRGTAALPFAAFAVAFTVDPDGAEKGEESGPASENESVSPHFAWDFLEKETE